MDANILVAPSKNESIGWARSNSSPHHKHYLPSLPSSACWLSLQSPGPPGTIVSVFPHYENTQLLLSWHRSVQRLAIAPSFSLENSFVGMTTQTSTPESHPLWYRLLSREIELSCSPRSFFADTVPFLEPTVSNLALSFENYFQSEQGSVIRGTNNRNRLPASLTCSLINPAAIDFLIFLLFNLV